jgi:hypothetical protein
LLSLLLDKAMPVSSKDPSDLSPLAGLYVVAGLCNHCSGRVAPHLKNVGFISICAKKRGNQKKMRERADHFKHAANVELLPAMDKVRTELGSACHIGRSVLHKFAKKVGKKSNFSLF